MDKAAHNKMEEEASAAAMETMRLQGAYQDAQVAAKRAEMRKKLMEENVELAGKQYAANSFLNTAVFANAIDATFFDQFGTTSR